MPKQLNVLVVEDSAAIFELIKEVFLECGLKARIQNAPDGKQAFQIIMSATPPELVILDLNLGRMGGIELLRELCIANPEFILKVPVIVLTSSTLPRDVGNALSLGAKCYHNKPMQLQDYMDLIQAIYNHWFIYAVLPEYIPRGS